MTRARAMGLVLLMLLAVFSGCGQYVEDPGTHDNPVDPGNPGAPDIPFSPSPADNATNVPVQTVLSWAATDPDLDVLTFDVYFGKTTSPVLVSENQSSISYTPGRLENSTRYYWRVIVGDGVHKISSPLWSFKTSEIPNNAPNTPGSPAPSSNTTGVSMLPELSWSATDPDEDELTFDLFFGTTSNPPLFKLDLDTTTYSLGNSGFAVTYFWKIAASDGIDVTTSPVWSFTTAGNAGQNPFPQITDTGLPATILVNTAKIDGNDLVNGDIVAVFDGRTCVGWEIIGASTTVLTAWEADPANGLTTGFTAGHTMRFVLWDQSTNIVTEADVTLLLGDGTFGTEPYAEVSLLGSTGH
ncbi:MAG: hypothetical protein V2A56_02905 [bacterium]